MKGSRFLLNEDLGTGGAEYCALVRGKVVEVRVSGADLGAPDGEACGLRVKVVEVVVTVLVCG